MKECTMVIFKYPLCMLSFDESPNEFICPNVGNFKALFKTDNNGFIDWLRLSTGKIIGVTWSAFDELDSEFVKQRVPDLTCIEFDHMNNLYIYFGDEKYFNKERSIDQDFGENNFYVSDTGYYAMSFTTFSLDN